MDKSKYVEKIMQNSGILKILCKARKIEVKYMKKDNLSILRPRIDCGLNIEQRIFFVNKTIPNIQEKCYKLVNLADELDVFIKKHNLLVKDNSNALQIKVLADTIRIISDLIRKDINKFVNQLINKHYLVKNMELAERIEYCEGKDFIIFIEVYKLIKLIVNFSNKLMNKFFRQIKLSIIDNKINLVIDMDTLNILWKFEKITSSLYGNANTILIFLNDFLSLDLEALLFLNIGAY